MSTATTFIAKVGSTGQNWFRTLGAILELLVAALICLANCLIRPHHFSWRQFRDQVLFTGVDALLLVGLLATITGITIAIQAITTMPDFGISEYFGSIMVIVIVRELGPFFTSLIVIGRSGAALAAYIGTMKANKEIAALEVMGIDLLVFLVVPALVGMIISLICLTVYFDLIAIVGGLFLARLIVTIDLTNALTSVFQALTLGDLLVILIKNVLFGATIAVMSCFFGLQADRIRFVPRSVHRAIVGSLTVTLFLTALITVIYYFFIGFQI
ncbi:ABC transporter permease [bacterium]|nr:ABC transporter permease [bacterium]